MKRACDVKVPQIASTADNIVNYVPILGSRVYLHYFLVFRLLVKGISNAKIEFIATGK